MTDDFQHDPLADALRHSLARHAADAPPGEPLAERIIASAEPQQVGPPRPGRRSWRAWTLPLVAAGAVAGVVAAVVGIENYAPTASGPPPAGSEGPSILQSPVRTTSPPPSTNTVSVAPVNAPGLTGVRIRDLTFVNEDEGWALGSADCSDGSGGRCTALLHTTDGTTWTSVSTTPFNVPGVSAGCADRCVSNIRFANPEVGYLFGRDYFVMTIDGGETWVPQDGGAIALETLDGNVIRVTADASSGCPGPCNVRVETSDIGSTTWTPADLPPLSGTAVTLARGGSNAYLLLMRNPAGGGDDATSTLYRSTNDGRTWAAAGEPCPQDPGEVDSAAVAAGAADRLSVLCVTRQAAAQYRVVTSPDAGRSFGEFGANIPLDFPRLLTEDPDGILVAAGSGLARSTDGGRTWQDVTEVSGRVTFVGFESTTVGRAVTDNKVIWTTRNAGKTWTSTTFG